MKKTTKRQAKSVARPAKQTPPSAGLDSRLTEGLGRLHERFKTWPKLANKIGRSTSLVQFWREGRNTITRDDAITLALLDEELDPDPLKRAQQWLSACGHSTVKPDWVESEILRRTNLTNRINDSLEALKELAGSKGLTGGDFTMALGCYLGQQRLGQEIAAWVAGTNGKGTTAFFWRWHDGLPARLMEDQTVLFVRGMIAPAPETRKGWSPTGIASELKVFLFFQVNEDAGDPEQVETLLGETIKKFRAKLSLDSSSAKRFLVYTTREKFGHPADCFVFVSPSNSLGVLVSDSNKLMRKVLNSSAEEMRGRPWDWCGQIIQIDGEEIIERECLKPKSVILNRDYAQLEVDAGLPANKRAWKIQKTE